MESDDHRPVLRVTKKEEWRRYDNEHMKQLPQ